MYVRSIYMTLDPANVGPAVDLILKEAPGMMAEQEGYRGFGCFADRTLGKLLVGSWWETEEAQAASDQRMRNRRLELLTPLTSTISTMPLEAAAFLRPPSATTGGFRLQRMMFDPATADELVNVYKEVGLAKLSELPGFSGSTLLLDRKRGIGSVGVVFKDMAALEASRGPQAAIRKEAFTRLPGAQLICLEEFEVADVEMPEA